MDVDNELTELVSGIVGWRETIIDTLLEMKNILEFYIEDQDRVIVEQQQLIRQQTDTIAILQTDIRQRLKPLERRVAALHQRTLQRILQKRPPFSPMATTTRRRKRPRQR